MNKLANISYYVISKTGFFHNQPDYFCQKIHSTKKFVGGFVVENNARVQTGVVRVNCVDCLDRTNTAQFALGKAALAFQLYTLGVLESPELEFDTDSVRMLEELYEDHGDTLALQYGGSQLVHRVKTYRKIAPLSSHSRDIMQTLSRYYSNTFSDADKQNAINLFLGVYEPGQSKVALWDLITDYYLHNGVAAGRLICHRNLYTCWWDQEVKNSLPFPTMEAKKDIDGAVMEIVKSQPLDPRVDGFFDHYRPFEMTTLIDLLPFSMNHSARDVMPNFSTDYSPFSVRVRPGKKRESVGEKPPNPSVTGISSTASASSGNSETESVDSSDDEDFVFLNSEETSSTSSLHQSISSSGLLLTMKQVYGMEPKNPSEEDMKIYEKFVEIQEFSNMSNVSHAAGIPSTYNIYNTSEIPKGSAYCVSPPTVPDHDLAIYEAYIQSGISGPVMPPKQSMNIYRAYCASLFQ